MTNKEKLALLEQMLEMEEDSISEEMHLYEIENWDSMSVLSLIALMDEKFGKRLTANQIKQFETIKDIIDYMG